GPVFGAVSGLTEAPWTCYRRPGELLDDRGGVVHSVGRPVGRHRVHILGDEGVMGPNHVGEVVIEGEHVMRGYWRDGEATEAVLRDRRFHTGDLGMLDEHGRLHVVGRTKEVIRTGGRSVEPREVEDAILRSCPVA